jgi:lycopene beta-cyclase
MIYDYAIIGAGAAGTLIADALLSDPHFEKCSVLIVDRPGDQYIDRTWCFWSERNHALAHLVSHQWSEIYAGDSDDPNYQSIAPYTYQMIRGVDFHGYFRSRIKKNGQVEWVEQEVVAVSESENVVEIRTTAEVYTAARVFDSRFDYKLFREHTKYPVLQQHFVGWFIKTEVPQFNPDQALFMDFSVPQMGNTRFMYVLPTLDREALVEYTLFSHEPLKPEAYAEAIKAYLSKKNIDAYEVVKTESGSIPMSCAPFWERQSKRIIPIGLSAGWAKPSTGFTFDRTLVRVKRIVEELKKGNASIRVQRKDRFWLYDLLLLDILDRQNHKGASIFSRLFRKRKPQLILRFLGEKTRFNQELSIMAANKPLPFLVAFMRRLFKGF